ncbi:MAG: DUF3501 family protein [Planctomycetes bacterium]|nr:DUF3501 family protein [Planctomycetota bacterium]
MTRVARDEIVDLAAYEAERPAFRARMMAEKSRRRVHLGDHLTFLFENHDTVRYQVQEMLRVEGRASDADVEHELATYNELLGGEGDLGCTLLIEIDDADERDVRLREWLALPAHLYVELEDGTRVRPRIDDRQVGEERLSSVQYLAFPVAGRAPAALGCDLAALTLHAPLTPVQRRALQQDLAD